MSKLLSLSDDQLVGLYTEGCNEAFDIILQRYDAIVHTYIRFSISDPDLAEDIFQDTFIKVIQTLRRGQYKPSGKFKSWLLRVSHNLIMDFYRQQKSQGTKLRAFSDNEDSPIDRLPSDAATAEEMMIEEASIAELEHYLSLLPKVQQEVIHMRFWQDMSFKEIANSTGVSINTALGRVRYALINLRKMVASS